MPQNTRSILESKGMYAIFQKKDKSMLRKGKIFENLNQNLESKGIYAIFQKKDKKMLKGKKN